MYALRIENLGGGNADLPGSGWAELGQELTVGRGKDNTLVLEDAAGVISKRHCTIANTGGGYALTDHSRNGTFLNGSGRPVEKGTQIPLKSGDYLQIGSYSLTMIGMSDPVESPDEPGSLPLSEYSLLGAVVRHGASASADVPASFSEPPIGNVGVFVGTELTAEDSIMLPARDLRRHSLSAAHSDHVSVTSMSYVPPRLSSDPIPDDWDLLSDLGSIPLQADTAPVFSIGPGEPARVEAKPPEGEAVPAASSVNSEAKTMDAITAFLQGCGLETASLQETDLPLVMLRAGQALRAAVSNLVDDLAQPGRVDPAPAPDQPNPLKMATETGEALLMLLAPQIPGRWVANEAVDQAFRESRQKSVAADAEMRRLLNDVLERLAPDVIKANADTDNLVDRHLPFRRAEKCWKAYQDSYFDAVQSVTAADGSIRAKPIDEKNKTRAGLAETSPEPREPDDAAGAGMEPDHPPTHEMEADVR